MAATKNLRTIIAAATTNTSGSTQTGTVVDLTTKYGGLLTVKITNGASAPATVAVAKVYTSGDNSNFKLMTQLSGDLVNNSVNEWAIDIPPGVMYLRVDVTGNTSQSITCEAFFQELTTI